MLGCQATSARGSAGEGVEPIARGPAEKLPVTDHKLPRWRRRNKWQLRGGCMYAWPRAPRLWGAYRGGSLEGDE